MHELGKNTPSRQRNELRRSFVGLHKSNGDPHKNSFSDIYGALTLVLTLSGAAFAQSNQPPSTEAPGNQPGKENPLDSQPMAAPMHRHHQHHHHHHMGHHSVGAGGAGAAGGAGSEPGDTGK
jgi:hypothetical protein